MLMVISPAKTLDFDSPDRCAHPTQPALLAHSAELITILRAKSPAQLAELMSISDKLAVLNAGRFSTWRPPFTPDNAKSALRAFMGDVYEGLDAATLSADQDHWLQDHLRILSGLYGCLRPQDLIQAYRLEMGSRLINPRGKNLYAFWGDLITDALNQALAGHANPILLNLASGEYFKAVHPARLKARILTPVFQDGKNGQYKVISFHAKHARGLMVRWAAQHALSDPEQLKAFNGGGYIFSAQASSLDSWVFRRSLEA